MQGIQRLNLRRIPVRTLRSAPVVRPAPRSRCVCPKALFDFLKPGGGAPSSRASEIADELAELAASTGGGSRAGRATSAAINALVGIYRLGVSKKTH